MQHAADALEVVLRGIVNPPTTATADRTANFTASRTAAATARTKIVLLGYSLGARVALQLAAQAPDLFACVACVSGTPGIQGARIGGFIESIAT